MASTMRRAAKALAALAVPLAVGTGYLLDRTGVLSSCARQPTGVHRIEIVEVIDGDTVVDACDRRIRLTDVDTPELPTAAGQGAAAFARGWLAPPQTVTMTVCAGDPVDRYGRVLARLEHGGRDMATELLQVGWAAPLVIPPCGLPRAATNVALAATARRAGRGMWAHRTTTAVDASTAAATDGYVVVADRVHSVERDGDGLRLFLGDARGIVEVFLPGRDRDRMLAAYPDLGEWAGRRIEVEGKLSRKGGVPRLWVSAPALLRPAPNSRDTDPQR